MAACVKGRAPRGLEETFLKALEIGQKAAEAIREKIPYERAPSPED
jgi:hypothetical protein